MPGVLFWTPRLNSLSMNVTVETPAMAQQQGATVVPGASEVGAHGNRGTQFPFAMAIFLSAFLLFQVQLILGKELLPLFGGAPAVWTVCVLVFQLLFLPAYGYPHGLAHCLPVPSQVIIHTPLLPVSPVFLS